MRHFWLLSNNMPALEYRSQIVLPDRSISIRQKLVKKLKGSNETFWLIFKQNVMGQKLPVHPVFDLQSMKLL